MKRKIMLAVAASVVALLPVMAQAANKLIVKGTDGTTDMMVVTDSGFVGVGTTSPAVSIHGKGSATQSQFRAHYNGLSASGGGSFVMLHNNGSIDALPKANDRVGAMYFGTEALNPVNNLPGVFYGAGITIKAEGDWSVTPGTPTAATVVAPAYITIDTATGTAGRGERLRISGKGIAVRGGVQVTPNTVRATCDVSLRGTIWATQAAAGSADTVAICVKLADNTYEWKPLF